MGIIYSMSFICQYSAEFILSTNSLIIILFLTNEEAGIQKVSDVLKSTSLVRGEVKAQIRLCPVFFSFRGEQRGGGCSLTSHIIKLTSDYVTFWNHLTVYLF